MISETIISNHAAFENFDLRRERKQPMAWRF